jgi:beta-xylosidase
MKGILLLLISLATLVARSQQLPANISVHDPVMIRSNGRFYLFCTGRGISAWSSSDMKNWKKEDDIFAEAPSWASKEIPGFNNQIWAFGSFWGGLKLAKLTKDRLKIDGDSLNIPTIASRAKEPDGKGNLAATENNSPDAGGNAIEGPFIFRKKNFYYLFASIDYCCKGPKSDYKIIVGRAKQVTGPYLDKSGVDMRQGGGSILLQGDNDWYGLGHNAVCSFKGADYLIYHAYDAADNGKPKLQIKKLKWTKTGWPEPI